MENLSFGEGSDQGIVKGTVRQPEGDAVEVEFKDIAASDKVQHLLVGGELCHIGPRFPLFFAGTGHHGQWLGRCKRDQPLIASHMHREMLELASLGKIELIFDAFGFVSVELNGNRFDLPLPVQTDRSAGNLEQQVRCEGVRSCW